MNSSFPAGRSRIRSRWTTLDTAVELVEDVDTAMPAVEPGLRRPDDLQRVQRAGALDQGALVEHGTDESKMMMPTRL